VVKIREDMNLRQYDPIHGVDDFVAEIALARRARQRRLAQASDTLCLRRFTHLHEPRRYDARGFLVVDTCECLLQTGHHDGCVCVHDIERRVYRVDADGREHYATRPLIGGTS
jgi:hypothetical protein